MRKKILSVFAAFAFAVVGFSQVTLPTTNDFSSAPALPNGWTADLTSNPGSDNFYVSSGNPAPAFAFKKIGRYLIVNVASAPGTMSYTIAGNSFNGGTFDVQESIDGTTYTAVKTYDNSNISLDGTYNGDQVTLLPTTRFIKFVYTNKVTGNVALDNVTITEAAVTHQVLKAVVNDEQIINNGTASMGSATNSTATFPFVIENSGSTDALVVSSIAISGTDASQFALQNVPTYPLTIAGLANANIGINFTPTSTGTKNATVTIVSNDIDYPTFTFNLVGYGDNLATEPSSLPSNLTFSNVKTYRLTASFTGTNADGYLILRKRGAITESPVDGQVYSTGDMIGNAKVVRMGEGTTFTPNDIVANTEYDFAIFAYNGTGTFTNYANANPLTASTTTPENMIPTGEYDVINVNNNTLISDLHDIIAPHTQQFYSNYAPYMMTKFYERDTTNNLKVITDKYTGKSLTYTAPFSHGGTGITREHTFASSWFPVQDINANFYSDYHNLFPVSQDEANGIRSNYPLGKVVSDTLQHIGQSLLGKNAAGNYVYEPSDFQKGTAARAMFYMVVRYTENGNVWKLPSYISSTIPYGQDQEILKQWNTQFPPTKLEIARNDYLDSLQKNRNPFIDHPEYACYIDFSTVTYLPDGCQPVGVKENNMDKAFQVYPNPTKDVVTLSLEGGQMTHYSIVDVQGRTVMVADLENTSFTTINVSTVQTGIYTLNVSTANGQVTKKLVIQ